MLKEQFEKNQFLVGMLVIIFVIMGTYYYYEFKELKKQENKYQKARIANVCPDYWENVGDGKEKSSVCKNTHKIGTCNILDGQDTKDFGLDLYTNTDEGALAKCNWSQYCDSPWEGYDHLCSEYIGN